jgi:tyrosyl-DNA phosphodiesterase 2
MAPEVESIESTLAAKLTEPPAQILDASHYEPKSQSYWSYTRGPDWQEHTPIAGSSSAATSAICLITWNIDILTGGAEPRMAAALEHLRSLVLGIPASQAVVIFLQEMGQSDMAQIRDTKWIQNRFFLTDVDGRSWGSPLYGTTTLVDHRLHVSQVFRVPWVTKFERDGLFVDLALHIPGQDGKVLRLCNTHLESLAADPPIRPLQLASAVRYLHEPQVTAALLAGDLNAIQPFDRALHSDNGLKDAYLELGGVEDSEEGYTWGQQAPQWLRDKFGCSRMDKILFCGSINVTELQRIGVGVKVVEEKRQEMRDLGCEEWVTDHYGLMATAELLLPVFIKIQDVSSRGIRMIAKSWAQG